MTYGYPRFMDLTEADLVHSRTLGGGHHEHGGETRRNTVLACFTAFQQLPNPATFRGSQTVGQGTFCRCELLSEQVPVGELRTVLHGEQPLSVSMETEILHSV